VFGLNGDGFESKFIHGDHLNLEKKKGSRSSAPDRNDDLLLTLCDLFPDESDEREPVED